MTFSSNGAVTGSVEIVWEYCIRLNLGGGEASPFDLSPCPFPANIQPTDSQRTANGPHMSAQKRRYAESTEVATVQPKQERLPASDRGTLAAVMPENHGVPSSNLGPAT